MQKITKRYNDEMGETGAGLKDASEINTGEKNAFTTKWGTYLQPGPALDAD